MAYENHLELQTPHRVVMEDRSSLSVSGVVEVERFDEETAVLHTSRGTLVVRGRELHLRKLTPDGGQVAVEGTVDALIFGDGGGNRSVLARLFG